MKILVADDHWVSRTGLRHSLSQLDHPVNMFLEANSFSNARKLAAERPDLDLILLDLLMPDGSGFEEITALTKIAPSVPIIVVSMVETRQDVIRALDAGAMGFIPKSAPGDTLIYAIEMVLRGEIYIPPQVFSASGAQEAGATHAVQPPTARAKNTAASLAAAARIPNLTRRQKEVFQLLSEGNSNASIAKILGISEHTIAIHVSAILKTLELENRTQAALVASSQPEPG
ncbi:MAG: response regulator transcription factor [Alphaproteobacteria bacterium]|nr:response regulator transcription factor [Alphaproteobacteria bacterium]